MWLGRAINNYSIAFFLFLLLVLFVKYDLFYLFRTQERCFIFFNETKGDLVGWQRHIFFKYD